jgi:argininosuccinate lyase
MVVLGDAVAERLHPITGSSVMAQKRNPDALELLRASAAQFAGFYASVSSVLCGLPTGYNRDSRETKEYIAIAFRKLFEMFHSLRQVVRTTSFDEKRMRQMIDENYSLTTDLADRLAQATGIPYRRMYKIVGVVVNDLMQSGKPLTSISVSAIVDSAKRLGATISPGSLDVMELLSVDKALGARAHVGGTCAERTREMLARRAGQYK